MNLNDAFKKSIRGYWRDKDYETGKMKTQSETRRYNKKYFDSVSKEFGLEPEDEEKTEDKPKKKKAY